MLRRLLKASWGAMVIAIAAMWISVQPLGSAAMAAQLTQQQINAFLANPSGLLAQNASGGSDMVAMVRDLMTSDPNNPNMLSSIIALLASANSAQQAAIGSGLGMAAQALVRTNPDVANQIQVALANSGVQTAIASFSSVTGNAVIGAAGGGGGGGGGGPTGSGAPSGGGGGGGGNNQGAFQGGNSQGGGFTGGGSVGQGGNNQGQNSNSQF
jgi:hypothetical protein